MRMVLADERKPWATISSLRCPIRRSTEFVAFSESAEWCIPAERMKMRRPHDVPLSHQALEVPLLTVANSTQWRKPLVS
jgi:hypothetical protein